MSISTKKKAEIVKSFGISEKDRGSTNVQVAILSDRISKLTDHLKKNK